MLLGMKTALLALVTLSLITAAACAPNPCLDPAYLASSSAGECYTGPYNPPYPSHGPTSYAIIPSQGYIAVVPQGAFTAP